jgi:molybdopterin-guanine dinucleotide biosynthesis protein A
MGHDKATLPFGPELMLQRVVRLMNEVVPLAELVVVAAPSQALPALPDGVSIVRDLQAYRGPLEGLATGLRSFSDSADSTRVDAVYATACDVPLLVPAFVERMFDLLGEFDIAVPVDGEHHHPLAAVYRPRVLQQVERLLESGQMRPRFLSDEVPTREVPVDELCAVDPQLSTLANLNHQKDYFSALAAAGFIFSAEEKQSN